jgi:hypothetical protein
MAEQDIFVSVLTGLNLVVTLVAIAVRRRGDAERIVALEREMGEALGAHDERIRRTTTWPRSTSASTRPAA